MFRCVIPMDAVLKRKTDRRLEGNHAGLSRSNCYRDLANTLVTCPITRDVAANIIGVARRLQAPFIIGAMVLLLHGITTFAPQVVAVYESASGGCRLRSAVRSSSS